jgi:N-acetylmuramoyl-L-alanine amidase
MSPKPSGRGWDRVGYSDMIHIDGSLENLTPYNQDNKVDPWEMTWGARGINSRSRHVVYTGGTKIVVVTDDEGSTPNIVPADTRTLAQLDTMEVYAKYMIKRHPLIQVGGHNQFAKKACPSFDVIAWAESIGIPKKNIYYGG